MKPRFKDILPEKGSGHPEWFKSRCVLMAMAGSHAYGTNIETSDVDVRGIVVPPNDFITGFVGKFEASEWKKPVDGAVYGLPFYFKLAAECNPNVLELIFSDEDDYIHISTLGLELRKARKLFLSKQAHPRYKGYAFSQIKRVRAHNKWLTSPPDHKPTREEFGLPLTSPLSADERGAYAALIGAKHDDTSDEDFVNKLAGNNVDENVLLILLRERQYARASRIWVQYQTWLADRNPARAELERKYGYDTKHISHCVRLLRQGTEILERGNLIVKRPDAEELKAIRGGAWTFEEAERWFEAAMLEIDKVLESSKLPTRPPMDELNNLCSKLVTSCIIKPLPYESVLFGSVPWL